ncbi:MAG: hypothetical protein DMG14_09705 [Acidobacteria bacterium]|nr:MAG: hypothetical protein DMG14_09705 [Acidobacteriota bacterium]
MRRFGVTIFLLFYGFSVAGSTVTRTEEWASQISDKFKAPRPHHGAGFAEAHKHSPHQVQTKLHEDTSVLISFQQTSEPPDLQTALHYRSDGFIADQKSSAISSRAPPSSL